MVAARAAHVFELFAMVISMDLTTDQVRGLFRSLFETMSREAESVTLRRPTDYELNEQL